MRVHGTAVAKAFVMLKKTFGLAALFALSSLIGCAEAPDDDGVANDDATVKVETNETSPAGFMDDYAEANGLTQAQAIPLCGDSNNAGVVGATQSQLFTVFGKTDMVCIPKTYDRGVGKPMQCADGLLQSGAICYRACKTGYTMVAGVCWQSSCPSGYRDDGAYCAKPAAYGRGTGYVLWDGAKCESQNSQGCEKWGAMWYPKCREGFYAAGANICSPGCPSGMTDIGVSCQKKTYVQNSSNTTPISYSSYRGIETPIFTAPLDTCAKGLERYGQLCYEPCLKGFTGKDNYCRYN